jgi:hypothetical protein
MSRAHCTRVTSAAGITVVGLGIGLAVSACGPTTPANATGTGAAGTAASTPASPAASTPASAPSASGAPSSGTGAPSSATAAASSSAPASGGSTATPVPVDGPFVVWNCENKPEVRPASLVLACADGSDRMLDMHWANWVPGSATGTGVQSVNDCTPDCAVGHFRNYPVDIKLTGSDKAGPNEPFAYTKITLTYTGPRPVTYVKKNGTTVATHPATWSQDLPLYHAA